MERLTDDRFLKEGFYEPKNREEVKEICSMANDLTFKKLYRHCAEVEKENERLKLEITQASKETTRDIFDTIIKALEERKERVKAFYGIAESVGADVAIRTVKHCGNCVLWKDEDCIETIKSKVLTLINELEKENGRLRISEAKAERPKTKSMLVAPIYMLPNVQTPELILKLGEKNLVQQFAERLKEKVKDNVNGENVDYYVDCAIYIDETLEEFMG